MWEKPSRDNITIENSNLTMTPLFKKIKPYKLARLLKFTRIYQVCLRFILEIPLYIQEIIVYLFWEFHTFFIFLALYLLLLLNFVICDRQVCDNNGDNDAAKDPNTLSGQSPSG